MKKIFFQGDAQQQPPIQKWHCVPPLAIHTQSLSREETLLVDTLKHQNKILWKHSLRLEETIMNIEEQNAKLVHTNTRLHTKLQEQTDLSKKIVDPKTSLGLDVSSNNAQVGILKDRKKLVVEQNSELVSYLLKVKCKSIGSIENKHQQSDVQRQRIRMQRTVVDGSNRKRTREEQQNNGNSDRNTKVRAEKKKTASDVIITSSRVGEEDGDTCGASKVLT